MDGRILYARDLLGTASKPRGRYAGRRHRFLVPLFLALLGHTFEAQAAPLPVTRGLRAHLVADDISGSGPVALWSGRTGTTVSADQTSAARQPTLVRGAVGSRAALRFDGIDDGMRLSANLFSSTSLPRTVFAVVRSEDVNGHILGTGSSSSGFLPSYGNALVVHANNFAYKANSASSGLLLISPEDTTDPGWQILSAVVTDGASELMTVCSSTTAAVSTNPYPYGASSIGASGSGRDPFAGDVAELVVYDGALSASDIAAVRGALAQFYGMSLPPTTDMDGDGIFDACDQDLVYLSAPQVVPALLSPSALTGGQTSNLVDAPSARSPDRHTQQSHVYLSGDDLRFELDLGRPYDLFKLHFWNYSGETFDVDTATVTFFDPRGVPVSSFRFEPQRGQAIIHAEDFRLPTSARGVEVARFLVQGSNQNVDFINVGFSATPVNRPPEATSGQVSTTKNTPLPIVLSGVDPDGDPVSYRIVAPPTQGRLVEAPPMASHNFEYTPDTGFAGTDDFSFVAHDGELDSSPAIIRIDVRNRAPVAESLERFTTRNSTVALQLSAVDPDGDTLVYRPATPSFGDLNAMEGGGAGEYVYSPDIGFEGTDRFTYVAGDGAATSNTATVTIRVANRAPVAQGATVEVTSGEVLRTTLVGRDPDGDPLSFRITVAPSSGQVVEGPLPELEYRSDPGFTGIDEVGFVVSDGLQESPEAFLRIEVNEAPNRPPSAVSQSVETRQGEPVIINLGGSDPDGDALVFSLRSDPERGDLTRLSGSSEWRYTPDDGFAGNDRFTFVANDGASDSEEATVTITVKEALPGPKDDGCSCRATALQPGLAWEGLLLEIGRAHV